MLSSRFDLEQEIERQFGMNVKRDSTSFELNITDQKAKQKQSNSSSAVPQSQPSKDARYQELKRKFESTNVKNQFKFTPTFSTVVAR